MLSSVVEVHDSDQPSSTRKRVVKQDILRVTFATKCTWEPIERSWPHVASKHKPNPTALTHLKEMCIARARSILDRSIDAPQLGLDGATRLHARPFIRCGLSLWGICNMQIPRSSRMSSKPCLPLSSSSCNSSKSSDAPL